MKISVLGAGAGGTAVAFDWAAHGHEVRLFDFEQFPDNVRHVAASGRIEAEGGLEGSAPGGKPTQQGIRLFGARD